MAAPVHENGVPVGSLTVASFRPGRHYTQTEREVLQAFAEHASLALTDARNFEDAVHQAFHDSLTGLPNRALFLDRLEHAHARSRRSGSPIAVLFMDLDAFKNVNDSLGHAAGDELLVLVSGRLRRWLRPSDTAARFGGDEFAVLLEDLEGPMAATVVADRILESLREPFAIQGQEVRVDASVGIATSSTPGSDDLLRNADLAMYRAKGLGKGRHQMFEPGMHVAVLERLELEVDLQRALERGEMALHYQPIVELGSGHIVGLEGLVRWHHPTRGLIQPDGFIPLAEETGQIHRLGQWVLERAARDAVVWNSGVRADDPVMVGVNLSGRQLQEPTLVSQIIAVLADTGLHPEQLVFEITETVLMHDLEGTVLRLQELRRLGVRLSVDDFGTGYSSLQYLRRFPLDSLKIAKSFVDGVGGPSQDAAVARAIIELGTSFQLRVVAEGIERAEQRSQLLELGCGHGQGFLFARPAAADQVERMLQAGPLVPHS
jgi:diguanylate cyclase (GGDEF)-like protein